MKNNSICICGGGSLGHVIAGVLSAKDSFEVTMLTRRKNLWQDHLEIVDCENATTYKGKRIRVTDDPADVAECGIVLLCLPGFLIKDELTRLKDHLTPGTPVGSVVSSTGFFFMAKNILDPATPLFGYQRVPYIARPTEYGKSARILGRKKELFVATLNMNNPEMIRELSEEMFDTPTDLLDNYLEASLTNSNPILHPARLYGLWHAWNPGIVYSEKAKFYEDWDVYSSDVLIALDDEFQRMIRKLPLDSSKIPPILAYYESSDSRSLTRKIRSIAAFKCIEAPMRAMDGGWVPDFGNRYFIEDIPYGLMFIKALAAKFDIPAPTTDRVLSWAKKWMDPSDYENHIHLGDIEI